ncbi:MAG: endolytic transglycosylase MltG [Alphaproteobacteria bacterium]|jgi:UPF0755 protein|nr:endolytic transglycosylase MltG [Alphaproteobacteria bacterium]
MKALFSILFLVIILAMGAAAAGWIWFNDAVTRAGPSDADTVFQVNRGESLVSVADRLETQGVIPDARLMRLKARLDGVETDIKAGEFELPARASIAGILARLVEGDTVQYRITIPEGLTTAQALRIISANETLTGDLPDPEPAEGALLPDTYLFTRGTSRADLAARMADAQDDLLDELWPERAADTPVTSREDAIILASVVQKEAGSLEEIDLVAGVFANRLERGIPLQSDPTVIYGVSRGEPLYNQRGERRTLYRSELDRETPWNTYLIPGLPETPICNPGRAAISAVLNPADTDYIFFVADGTGGHAFAETLAEHNRNVAAYRRYEAEEIARERAE